MPIATGTAIALAAAGALGGSAIGAVGASKAAGAQATAGLNAAQLEYKSQQDALAFQKEMYGTEQANIAPFLKAGTGAITQLSSLLGTGGFPDFSEKFQAPTNVTEANDPGYQFRLQQGMEALQNSAAARGNLLTGGTAKAITQYGQDFASNEYQNVYNRALGEYQQRYNIFQQNQANRFNRLASVAGVGQTAAGQLGSLGQATAGNVSNILLGGSANIGNTLQNIGAARASGYAGLANALGGGLSSIPEYLLLNSLLGQKPASLGNV